MNARCFIFDFEGVSSDRSEYGTGHYGNVNPIEAFQKRANDTLKMAADARAEIRAKEEVRKKNALA